MLERQPNRELLLDSKTHSSIGDQGGLPALQAAFVALPSAAEGKKGQSALDFSHSNPDFCHPKSRENLRCNWLI
jgi:hypothetical protein